MNEIEKSVFDAIKNIFMTLFKKYGKFDKTERVKITAINVDGTYDVEYMGETISNIKARDGLTLVVNDVVYIRVVQGNFSEKFIDCKIP